LELARRRAIVLALLALLYAGAALLDFKVEVVVVLAFLLALVFGQLMVFAPRLAEAKRRGLREYGALAERYVREFDAKWLRGGAPAEEPFVGSGTSNPWPIWEAASKWSHDAHGANHQRGGPPDGDGDARVLRE
jgi:hypothetical protein